MLAAQETKLQEFTAGLQSESAMKKCFGIARQMVREGIYVISVCCMKNYVRNVVSDVYSMNYQMRKHMEKLLNVKNE